MAQRLLHYLDVFTIRFQLRRVAIVVRNRLTGETTQRLASAEKIAGPEFQAWLRHKNARGADDYISQNTFRPDARTRSKAGVDNIRHVYVDLDTNGEDALAKVGGSSLVPEPSVPSHITIDNIGWP